MNGKNVSMPGKSKEYFIITQGPECRNSELLTPDGVLRPELRRTVDYVIVPGRVWNDIKGSYDIEISTAGVCHVHISFQCHGESHKTILVHRIEKVFDVVLTLFVNKIFGLDVFKRMFVVRHGSRAIDPVVSFEWFDAEEVHLTVERVGSRHKKKRTASPADADEVAKSSTTHMDLPRYSRLDATEPDELSTTTDSSTNTDLYVDAEGRRGCVGLPNLGNTCFMNSAVQCVMNCREMCRYFLELRRSDMTKGGGAEDGMRPRSAADSSADNNKAGGSGRAVGGKPGRTVEEWCNLVYAMHEHSQVPMCKFKAAIGEVYGIYKGSEEQDSFEFINNLLDTLHEQLKMRKKREIDFDTGGRHSTRNNVDADKLVRQADSGELVIENAANREPNINIIDNGAWSAFLYKNNTIIARLFYGLTTTTLRCTRCGYIRYKNEPFMSLSLPIPSTIKYHPSVTLVFESSKPAIRIMVPITLSVRELYSNIASRYDIKSDMLAVEYRSGTIHRRLLSTMSISPVGRIVVFEYSKDIVYRLCTLTCQRLYFFKDKFAPDFIIPANSVENMNILIYRKLEPFLVQSFSVEELFHNIEISYQPACPVFGIPTLNLHFPRAKNFFGPNLDVFRTSTERASPISLLDCLDAFMQDEAVTLTCDGCSSLSLHGMSVSFARLPEVLIIHLKRYARTEAKINSFVDFPTDDLVISGVHYRLTGTCNHIEIGLGYGHYLAYVRRDGNWYSCNDSVISKSKEIDGKSAYVLFYQRA